jgi:hypothetical protein
MRRCRRAPRQGFRRNGIAATKATELRLSCPLDVDVVQLGHRVSIDVGGLHRPSARGPAVSLASIAAHFGDSIP